jgi:GAF domain-containing protein
VRTDASMGFPDLPRSELEKSIGDLVEKAQDVLQTQGRLRNLLAATRAIAEDLELEDVLRRIAQAAVDLVGARYGALGVIGPDGRLEQFIHVGIDAGLAATIGHLPQGLGVLGALIDDPEPVRREHLAEDPRSVGFPAAHPPMDSFLGVPIRVRDEVYGNLYLTDRKDGPFSAEDEELLMSLAAAAGVAIDNARLFGDAQRRQRWALAQAEVASALLDEDGADPLGNGRGGHRADRRGRCGARHAYALGRVRDRGRVGRRRPRVRGSGVRPGRHAGSAGARLRKPGAVARSPPPGQPRGRGVDG